MALRVEEHDSVFTPVLPAPNEEELLERPDKQQLLT
jgi:hypothetical protein